MSFRSSLPRADESAPTRSSASSSSCRARNAVGVIQTVSTGTSSFMSRGDKRVNDHDSPRTPRKAIFPKGEKAQEMDYGRPDTRQLRKGKRVRKWQTESPRKTRRRHPSSH
ncbi:hypothetical protein PSCLAVI8L_190039 [Pseudoclavibacter sp. 8L]|nr:hypothetical protein PSCLAVI8L_190039 [Pseudoclavibacter sp. 8L]